MVYHKLYGTPFFVLMIRNHVAFEINYLINSKLWDLIINNINRVIYKKYSNKVRFDYREHLPSIEEFNKFKILLKLKTYDTQKSNLGFDKR